MEQNLKELLLKDLCARLPYGVKMTDGVDIYRLTSQFLYKYIEMELKPYLRPMSSMTEEEIKEFQAFHCVNGLHPYFYQQMCNLQNLENMIDWLNAHHFDYRNLIGLGLALEAPDDIYNLKEE